MSDYMVFRRAELQDARILQLESFFRRQWMTFCLAATNPIMRRETDILSNKERKNE